MGDAKRKNKILIINKILDLIDKKELTINEIADKIDSHWLTVRDTLNFLISCGLVEMKIYGTEKRYMVASTVASKIRGSDLTYYQVPIDKKTENLALYIFDRIKEKWLKIRGTMINKTFLQKIAVDVIEKLNLSIPCGWYKFGKITIFNVDPSITYEYDMPSTNVKEMDEQIDESIELFKKYKYTWEIRKHQYKEHNNVQYLINHNLELIGNKMIDLSSQHNQKVLLSQLNSLQNLIPDNEDTKEIKLILLKFILKLNYYLSQENFDINRIKLSIHAAYQSIWDLIATYNFCDSLSQLRAYDKETLKSYFRIFIKDKIVNTYDRISELEAAS